MKTKLLTIMLLTSIIANSQEQITFGIYQDVKLVLGMDKEHLNDKPTFDMVFNLNLEGNQFEYYYFSIQAQYEHSDLYGGKLDRYGVNLMWNFNKLIIDDLTASFGFGGHVISRPWIDGMATYSLLNELSYEIFDFLDLSIKNEWVKRNDLPNKKIGYNLYFGVKIKPF